jgi:hypothetical protein
MNAPTLFSMNGTLRVPARPASISWMRAAPRALQGAMVIIGLGILVGCAATPPCRQGAKGDVVLAARTTGEAVETGAKTGVEGVKAAGRTVGGWVEGGSDEAKEKWKEGKQDTKETAHEGAADTRREATVPTCKD